MIFNVTINKIKKWSKDKNLEKLVNSLENKDAEIRKAAVLSIGALGDKAAIDYIRYIYDHEPDYFVKQDVQRSIEKLEHSMYDSRLNYNVGYERRTYNLIPSSQGA
jgi:hypothetical protein